jgi:hypothetical protein
VPATILFRALKRAVADADAAAGARHPPAGMPATTPSKHPFLELPGTLRRFSHEELLAGTDSMSPARLLGKGGFGPVYLIKEDGVMFPRNLAAKVGANVGEAGVGQGRNEFENEALLLWLWQHERIVRLEGVSIGQVNHPRKRVRLRLLRIARELRDMEAREHRKMRVCCVIGRRWRIFSLNASCVTSAL